MRTAAAMFLFLVAISLAACGAGAASPTGTLSATQPAAVMPTDTPAATPPEATPPLPAHLLADTDTPEQVRALIDAWPASHRVAFDQDVVILLAYPYAGAADWTSQLMIHHIPSASSANVDLDGCIVRARYNTPEAEARIAAAIEDEALMADLRERKNTVGYYGFAFGCAVLPNTAPERPSAAPTVDPQQPTPTPVSESSPAHSISLMPAAFPPFYLEAHVREKYPGWEYQDQDSPAEPGVRTVRWSYQTPELWRWEQDTSSPAHDADVTIAVADGKDVWGFPSGPGTYERVNPDWAFLISRPMLMLVGPLDAANLEEWVESRGYGSDGFTATVVGEDEILATPCR